MATEAPKPDYATTYRRMTDGELDRLMGEFDDLVDEARPVAVAELKARGRNDQEISVLIEAGRKRRLPLASVPGADLDLTAQIGSLHWHNGTGRTFYGKANRVYDEVYAYDEFDTTLWWTLLWIPFIPRGSFRIRRKQARPENSGPEARVLRERPAIRQTERVFPYTFSAYSIAVVRRLPFAWAQNAAMLALAGVLLWLPLAYALIGILLGLLTPAGPR